MPIGAAAQLLQRAKLDCHSDGIGKASTCSVCLPHLAMPDHHGAHGVGEPPREAAGRALRILIVDDNVDASSMLGILLEASGHEVMLEYRGPETLARAQAARPDICLLDIGLPGMDGTELARRLRQLPETAEAVLIAVTGYGQDSDRRRTKEAGFDHHLVRPVDIEQVYAILAQA